MGRAEILAAIIGALLALAWLETREPPRPVCERCYCIEQPRVIV